MSVTIAKNGVGLIGSALTHPLAVPAGVSGTRVGTRRGGAVVSTGVSIVPTGDAALDRATQQMARRFVADAVVAAGRKRRAPVARAPGHNAPLEMRTGAPESSGASGTGGASGPNGLGGVSGPSGKFGHRSGEIKAMANGGAWVYTASQGWIQFGMPMDAHKPAFLEFIKAGFLNKEKIKPEDIAHVVATHIIHDDDFTPYTTGLLGADFERNLVYLMRLHDNPDGKNAKRTIHVATSELAKSARDFAALTHGGLSPEEERAFLEQIYPDPATRPDLVAECEAINTVPTEALCEIREFVNGDVSYIGDAVRVVKVDTMQYAISEKIDGKWQHIADINLADKKFAIPKSRWKPSSAEVGSDELLRMRGRVFRDGETVIWPLGTSDNFTVNPQEATSGHMLIKDGRITLVDPSSHTFDYMEAMGIPFEAIDSIYFTHAHTDHFGDMVPRLLRIAPNLRIYAHADTMAILTKAYHSALGGRFEGLEQWTFKEIKHNREFVEVNGMYFRFHDTWHSLPTRAFEVWTQPSDDPKTGSKLVYYYSADTLANRAELEKKTKPDGSPLLSKDRVDEIMRWQYLFELTLDQNPPPLFLIEAGVPPIHTPVAVTDKFLQDVSARRGIPVEKLRERVRLFHLSDANAAKTPEIQKWKMGLEGVISLQAFFGQGDKPREQVELETRIRCLRYNPLFSALNEKSLNLLARHCHLEYVGAQTKIDPTKAMVQLVSGKVEVNRKGQTKKTTATSGLFSRLDTPKGTSITTTMPSWVLKFDEKAESVLRHAGIANTHVTALEALSDIGFISGDSRWRDAIDNSVLSEFPLSLQMAILSMGAVQTFAEGETLFEEGASGPGQRDLLLVLSGEVYVNGRGANGKEFSLTRTQGDLVGEMAFVTGAPRTASAKAGDSRPAVVLRFSYERVEWLKKAFPGLVGALERLSHARLKKMHATMAR